MVVLETTQCGFNSHPQYQNGKIAKMVYAGDWKSSDGGSLPPLPTNIDEYLSRLEGRSYKPVVDSSILSSSTNMLGSYNG